MGIHQLVNETLGYGSGSAQGWIMLFSSLIE